MSTPLRPRTRASSGCVAVKSAPEFVAAGPATTLPFGPAGCQRICPDILTFNHADARMQLLVCRPASEIGVDVTVDVELDRSSPVPLYYQLAQAIEAAIRD